MSQEQARRAAAVSGGLEKVADVEMGLGGGGLGVICVSGAG